MSVNGEMARRGSAWIGLPNPDRVIDRETKSITSNILAPMDTQRRIPEIQIRVLIIGRANVGRTTLLQRVCDTTESPFMIYRGNEVVRVPTFCC